MHSAGLLDLLDELTAGTLIMPRGHALNPTEEAVAWADSGAEQVAVEAWPVLGVPGASADTSLVSHPLTLHHLLRHCVGIRRRLYVSQQPRLRRGYLAGR